MSLWIKEEVRPVWISLHVSELKELSQAQAQNLLTNLAEAKKIVLHLYSTVLLLLL